jgi:hypothetical protein
MSDAAREDIFSIFYFFVPPFLPIDGQWHTVKGIIMLKVYLEYIRFRPITIFEISCLDGKPEKGISSV